MTEENLNTEKPEVKEPTAREALVMKMKYYGLQSGKGGFRKPTTGSNRNSRKVTRKDQLKANAYYQENVDIFYEYTVDQLEEMIIDGKAYFRENITDGSSIVTARKITGSALGAFQDVLQQKMLEKIQKETEEAKEKAEKLEQEMKAVKEEVEMDEVKAKAKAKSKTKTKNKK